MSKPTNCPFCDEGSVCIGNVDSDYLVHEPCPLCLGSGQIDKGTALMTIRALRKSHQEGGGKVWPPPGTTRDAMTGEVLR